MKPTLPWHPCWRSTPATNEELLDELFRQSGLYRDKWDREDYRERVLAMALDRDEFYSWVLRQPWNNLPRRLWPKALSRCRHQEGRKTQTQRLIEIAEAGEFGERQIIEPYVTIRVAIIGRTGGSAIPVFAVWLVGRYTRYIHSTPTDTAMKSALEVLEYKAMSGAVHEVYLRIARLEDRIYWDLGNEKWEAIEITAQGWRVIDRPPVKFRRTTIRLNCHILLRAATWRNCSGC